MNNQPEKHDLVISRVFDAPIEQVWRAWTDPEYVKQWWGPEGFSCSLARMDVREGAASVVGMRSPEHGEHYSLWQYQKIVPHQHIEFIHNLADEGGSKIDPADVGMPPDFPKDQRQTVTFKALDNGKTELTITEYGWTAGQMMEMSRMGMEQCLDKMAAMFARLS